MIVAGGTMKPVTDFRKRLFINAGADNNRIVEFCCDHIISAENILPIIVTTGLKKEPLLFNYNNRSSMVKLTLKSFFTHLYDLLHQISLLFFYLTNVCIYLLHWNVTVVERKR